MVEIYMDMKKDGERKSWCKEVCELLRKYNLKECFEDIAQVKAMEDEDISFWVEAALNRVARQERKSKVSEVSSLDVMARNFGDGERELWKKKLYQNVRSKIEMRLGGPRFRRWTGRWDEAGGVHCSLCEAEKEDVCHVLWRCEKLNRKREEWIQAWRRQLGRERGGSGERQWSQFQEMNEQQKMDMVLFGDEDDETLEYWSRGFVQAMCTERRRLVEDEGGG